MSTKYQQRKKDAFDQDIGAGLAQHLIMAKLDVLDLMCPVCFWFALYRYAGENVLCPQCHTDYGAATPTAEYLRDTYIPVGNPLFDTYTKATIG